MSKIVRPARLLARRMGFDLVPCSCCRSLCQLCGCRWWPHSNSLGARGTDCLPAWHVAQTAGEQHAVDRDGALAQLP